MFMNLERVVKGLWETRGEQREGGILEFIFFLFFFSFSLISSNIYFYYMNVFSEL